MASISLDTWARRYVLTSRAGIGSKDAPGDPALDAQRIIALSVDGDAWAMRRLRNFLADCGAHYRTDLWTDREVVAQVAELARFGMLAVSDADPNAMGDSSPTAELANSFKKMAQNHLRWIRKFSEEQILAADYSFIDRFLEALERGNKDREHEISLLKLVLSSTSKLPAMLGLSDGSAPKKLTDRYKKLKTQLTEAQKRSDTPSMRSKLSSAARKLAEVDKIFKNKKADKKDTDKAAKLMNEVAKTLKDLPDAEEPDEE